MGIVFLNKRIENAVDGELGLFVTFQKEVALVSELLRFNENNLWNI